jgi:predicted acylesterase/phospholipase RssA
MVQQVDSVAVKLGKEILSGKHISPAGLLRLVGDLKKERAFGLARKLLDKYADVAAVRSDARVRLKVAQQRALCTYKDPDLLVDERLEKAVDILRMSDDIERTTDRETLGLMGAIYKRKWEATGQERDLEQALAFYQRGWETGTTEDYGWNGINAAFILDLLASHESGASTESAAQEPGGADYKHARANQIRLAIVQNLSGLMGLPGNEWLRTEWWCLATMAEAHFGLDEYAEAAKSLVSAKALNNRVEWEYESTARQLATLLLVKKKLSAETAGAAYDCLKEFLGNDYALTSVVQGKIGLALSGGGFRASLYHIGVLARLAELDLLRSVEYLSCVSGGSIIGAYYYLEVRKLLQSKHDDEIKSQDYVDIVKCIETEFLKGVQKNLRTQVLAEWSTSLKMMLWPEYSRTKRAGELYETELYGRIGDGENGSIRWLNELIVIPKGEDEKTFRPKDHNWRRSNKVPILILNATSLNTGHNWQFTATWMGEPPGTIDTIDANYRLRRMYYGEAPEGHKRIRLGYAVAASACVPGIFEPLPLNEIYEREIPKYERNGKSSEVRPIVRLVDGGVHDNQGVAALLDQGCNVFLVSDASGQMNTQDFPSNKILGVPLRANHILQARVREAQYRELRSLRRSGLLKGLMFVHLKSGLRVDLLDWIASKDPSEKKSESPLLPYGVDREIQRRLAAVRTDLDSFSDAEAYTLMCSGYLMTEHALAEKGLLGFDLPQAGREEWRFLQVEELMKQPGEANPLLRQLKVSDKLFGKVWSLVPWLKFMSVVVTTGVLGAMFFMLLRLGRYPLPWQTWGELIAIAILIVVSAFVFERLSRRFNYRKTLDQIFIGLGLVIIGSFLAKLHLCLFDKMFLRQGSMDRLFGQNQTR